MAKNYKGFAYFESRPDIVKIFTDLEAFHDYCRFELLPFNPADLYNKHSKVWKSYERACLPAKDRKPYAGKKARTDRTSKVE